MIFPPAVLTCACKTAEHELAPSSQATTATALPVAPDRVRQFCEESRDGGKTWQVVFDGLYIPIAR
jgi:hypothetical protein